MLRLELAFYGLTEQLDRRCLVLGLCYYMNFDNSNYLKERGCDSLQWDMKPRLKLAIGKCKPYWDRYTRATPISKIAHHSLKHLKSLFSSSNKEDITDTYLGWFLYFLQVKRVVYGCRQKKKKRVVYGWINYREEPIFWPIFKISIYEEVHL